MQARPLPIALVESSRLAFELAARPHETYCEAARRGADICVTPSRWVGRKAAQATRECEQLRAVVRAYYSMRAEVAKGSGRA